MLSVKVKKSLTVVLLGWTGVALSNQAFAATGEEIYNTVCFVCHKTGVANAPKLGDQDAWNKRLEQGIETIYDNSLKGKNAMPPKGGASNYSDDEIKAAVDYMLESVK